MVLFVFFLCLSFYSLNLHAQEPPVEDSVFLCTERPVDSLGMKMVYGYLDGEKTECMSEQKLLSLLSESEFQRKQDSVLAEKKKSDDYYLQAIAEGRKDMREAPLRMTDLMGAKLQQVDFSHADLSNADLRDADLSGSILRNANLAVAYCKNVDFSGADLSGAKLEGAYLNGANLKDVEGLTYDLLRTARTVYQAKLPSSLSELIKQNAPQLLEKPKQGWLKNSWAPDSLKDADPRR